jgi:hypothetical protein
MGRIGLLALMLNPPFKDRLIWSEDLLYQIMAKTRATYGMRLCTACISAFKPIKIWPNAAPHFCLSFVFMQHLDWFAVLTV